MKDLGGFFALGVLIGIIIGAFLMSWIGDKAWHNKSVSDGVAEYYLDNYHNRQWRWITNR